MNLFLRVAMALVAICFFAFFATSASADVTTYVTDDGTDIEFHMFGTMDLTGTTADVTQSINVDRTTRSNVAEVNQLFSMGGTVNRDNGAGALSGQKWDLFQGVENNPSNGTGTSFGFVNDILFWDPVFGSSPGEIQIDRKWTVFGRTIESMFGNDFENSTDEIILWTHATSGDTVGIVNGAFSAVPEPSSLSVLGLVSLAGLLRRRRKESVV